MIKSQKKNLSDTTTKAIITAIEIGIDIDRFWKMTPFEFRLYIIGYRNAKDREDQRQKWLIWHQAAMERQKKLIPLKTFLEKGSDKKPVQGIDENAIKERLKVYQARKDQKDSKK